nr:MAG TPA: Tail fiber protein [Caudoviricetes sp.]
MLGVNQLDFINYCNALKGNYRKGVHKMETLLENPTHAKEFASNLGGVSVVLGTPVGKEDRNSETLRSMLLASDVANDAVYTWMGQYYEFDSWDELLGDEDRCKAMMANELLWRALSASGVAMGKTVATLAGLSCSAYDDMSAVAASSTAMAAVANNKTALTAVINNASALNTVVSSSTAMTAIASSQTAMAAIATSSTAMSAISASTTAINALKASPLLVAKTKSGNNWTTETVRSGRGIAVYIYGASVSGGNGWVKTDNVQTTFSSNGTNQNLLKAFQTSLSVYWYQNSSTLYYIPC